MRPRLLATLLILPVTMALSGGPAANTAAAAPKKRVKLEHPRTPAWVRREREAIEKAQAPHSLAGLGRELREGRKVDLRKLPPAVRMLHAKVKGRAAGLRKRTVPLERRFERLVAPKRTPHDVAPRSWKRAEQALWTHSSLDTPDASSGAPSSDGSSPSLLATSLASDPHLLPTVDAPSDHPLIARTAAELGHDPIRIYNFVHDTITTELYAGSKKGAVGTLRERAGNDVDQASLLIALYRAAGIPARYEVGNLAFTPAQANEYAGVEELSVASGLLSSAGIPNAFQSLGAGRGIGLLIEHTWVRVLVDDVAYRGVSRPGGVPTWVHLSPAIKTVSTHAAVDLRDAVHFDFDAYLTAVLPQRPLERYEAQLRAFVRDNALRCPTLDDAQKGRTIVPADLEILPSELPVVRVSSLATFAEVPTTERHVVRFQSRASQGTLQFNYHTTMPELWGKSVTVVYEPATAADAATIAQYGGIEQTPAYLVRLQAKLKIDAVTVATGTAENPGLNQRLLVDTVSPATGTRRVEHPLIVSGIYALALDPGLVPSGLLSERTERYLALAGDDLEAEKLYVTVLTYLHDLGRARERIAGVHWHRIYKEIEESAAMVVPRVEEFNGVPLAVPRDFFTFDAPGLLFGDFSIDGNHARTTHLTRLYGYESSVLEHRMGERFRGAKAYSAVKILQASAANGVPIVSFAQGNLEEALEEIDWPEEREQRLRDFANQGYALQAPALGLPDADLGTLFGFIATNPETGVGAYIVGSLRGEVNGAEGSNGQSGTADPGCRGCGETGSPVHLASGNMPLSFTDLTLPGRGMRLHFTRTFNTRLGWTHNFRERLVAESDGSLSWVDENGISWRFHQDSGGVWQPPPKQFQHVVATAAGFEMRFKDGLVRRFDGQGRLLAHEDLNGHAVELEYGPDDRLALITAGGGNFFEFEYDPQGRLVLVTDSAGRQVSFTYDGVNIATETDVLGNLRTYGYDSFGRMRSRSDGRGNVWRYSYDDIGRIVRLEDALGGVDTYAYDYVNRRTSHVDRRGHALTFELNDLAKVIRRVDPLGNETQMTYDPRGNKTSELDARGGLTVMTYAPDGDLLSRTDPLDAETTFVYGDHARLLETTDALTNTTVNAYDPRGNLLTTTDALGHVTEYTYTADGLPESIARPGGAVTQMFYDAAGNVVSMIDPEGGETIMAYDPAGHLVSTTDPEGGTRTMVVDVKGQMLSITDAATEATTFDYDEDGNRLSVTDPEQHTTTFVYDALSRVAQTTDTLGHTTRQEYDAEGNVIARIDADGARSTMRYDAIGRLVESCGALGKCTSMAYCAELGGPPKTVVDALGNTSTGVCDELGREVSRTDALGNVTLTSYDELGRRESVTDSGGHVTSFEYDDLGRLVSATDALMGVTRYGYDERGNRTSVTDANDHTTLFEYDLADRLIKETTPIGTVTEYGYDDAGSRATKLDGKGQLTRFIYDDNRRLTEIEYADGTSASFDYDSRGHRVSESNIDSTRTLTYDELGRTRTVLDFETGRTISYGYDSDGHRASMTVAPDAETTSYAWDSRGLLLRMTDPEGDVYRFGYDDLGRRVTTAHPNGMTLRTVYDAASRVLSMVYRNRTGGVIESFTYTYDSRGNRTAKAFADGGAEVYGYDELSRLTRVTYPNGRVVQYDYDAVGNRLRMVEGTSGAGSPACSGDQDCDAVEDVFDNCPSVVNADQLDSDAVTPDAVAAWRLDEESGSTAADAVGSHHGTLLGGASRTDQGRFGRAVQLDGINDSVQVADAPSLRSASAITLEAWMYPTRTGVTEVVMEKGDVNVTGYGLFLCPGARPSYALRVTGGLQSGGLNQSLALNTWHHLALSFDSARPTRSKFYVDGAEVAATATTCVPLHDAAGMIPHDGSTLQLGSRRGTGLFLQGRVDEAAVWSRALGGDEVRRHFDTGLFGDRLGDACDPCPSSADPACAPTTCMDADDDGYGVLGASACSAGQVAAFDCDDSNAHVRPGAVEVCDGIDGDCDGQVDEQCLVGAQITSYTYNAFNQLLSATVPSGTTTLTYDDNGNQTSKIEPGATTILTWDARDRLAMLALPGGSMSQFGYDANNLRVSTQDAGGSRRILLDGVEELAEYSSGSLTVRYDHDASRIDGLLGQQSPTTKVHAINDALGSVYALTDTSSSAVSNYDYDVYGSRTSSAEAVATKRGFTGRVHEVGGSDLVYYRARYLDAGTGRFVASDPAREGKLPEFVFQLALASKMLPIQSRISDSRGRPGTATVPETHYSYTGENPVTYRDPLGLWRVNCNRDTCGEPSVNPAVLRKAAQDMEGDARIAEVQLIHHHEALELLVPNLAWSMLKRFRHPYYTIECVSQLFGEKDVCGYAPTEGNGLVQQLRIGPCFKGNKGYQPTMVHELAHNLDFTHGDGVPCAVQCIMYGERCTGRCGE